jgi:4-amino-4-deoxy-L-arabinose transferase-like glycosyltransferase
VRREPAEPVKVDAIARHRRIRRIMRGLALMLVGFGATFLMMANGKQIPHGPLWGMFTLALGVGGLMDACGLFTRPTAEALSLRTSGIFPKPGEPMFFAPLVTVPVSLLLFLAGSAAGGVDGLPITIFVALVPLLASAVRRPMLLVVFVAAILYLPFLGAYGLWDPWETHYGEVSREILSRDDWISLWWAQEDWFWSKPILIFWIEALSMGAFGTAFQPDANPAHPEWAIRFPHFFLTVGALVAVYALVSKVWSKRAGVLAAVVLATMPHFFFLAHQAITDMPFVATMTIAMCMLGLALVEEPDREVKRYAIGPFEITARHVLIGAISLVVIPQIIYLLSRNVTLDSEHGVGFAWHSDVFLHGSNGNHGIPGNSPVHNETPVYDELLAQPMAQGLVWLFCYAGILAVLLREKRAQSLYAFAFYFFCALSFMAKGIPGFALPGLVALLFLIGARRWDLLLSGRLRVGVGMLIVATTGLPWYVAMYMRHGPAFTERLLIHDHINRLTSGVHGDTGSIEYFIEQLGYGLFPWIALAPLALAGWLALRREREPEPPGIGAPAVRETRVIPRSIIWTSVAAGSIATIGFAVLRLVVRVSMLMSSDATPTALLALTALTAFVMLAGFGTLVIALLWRGAGRLGPAGPPVSSSGVLVMVMLWFTAAFALFSAMTTKFHHYIFPAVPPAAILVALAIDRMLEPRTDAFSWKSLAATAMAIVAPLPAVLGVAGLCGNVRGILPEGLSGTAATDWVLRNPSWHWSTCLVLVGVGTALLAGSLWLLAPHSKERAPSRGLRPAAVTTGLIAAPVLAALVGRDLSWVTDARPQGYERLIHLFVYNYGRPWPESLDYRPILTGFAIVATVTVLIAAIASLRPVMMRAFIGVALCFALWSLDVYLIDLSPHWGQRELIHRYYEIRHGPEEPLVAWQMNWKGENFYSGNRVSVFADLDTHKLTDWVREHQGITAYFLLEHGRVGSLRGVLRDSTIDEITDQRLNNKFVLIRARIGQRQPPLRQTLD